MAAGCMQVGRLVVAVGWVLRLRVLLGWIVFEGVMSAGGLRWRGRCGDCIVCLGVGWGWVASGGGVLSAAVVIVSSLMSVKVSIPSGSCSSAARNPERWMT